MHETGVRSAARRTPLASAAGRTPLASAAGRTTLASAAGRTTLASAVWAARLWQRICRCLVKGLPAAPDAREHLATLLREEWNLVAQPGELAQLAELLGV